LREDPTLLQSSRARVAAWLESGSVARWYAERWRELLDEPLERILALLGESSERMHDLRQTSPFAGLIDARTRWRIRDDVRRRHETH
jgi:hypothetical protein